MTQLHELAEKGKWHELVRLSGQHLTAGDKPVDFFIDAMYLLQSALLGEEFDISPEQANALRSELGKLFRHAAPKYKSDPEFLFYLGYAIAECDWCFELEGVEEGHRMLELAHTLDPDNLLYAWGYSFSTGQPDSETLSFRLSNDDSLLREIQAKGFAGGCLAETIRDLPEYLAVS